MMTIENIHLPRTFNMRDGGIAGQNAVRIDRLTKWGNPFRLRSRASLGERKEVIEAYRCWLLERPDLVEQAKRELRGKNLACWCAPLPCHGDVLIEIANKVPA